MKYWMITLVTCCALVGCGNLDDTTIPYSFETGKADEWSKVLVVQETLEFDADAIVRTFGVMDVDGFPFYFFNDCRFTIEVNEVATQSQQIEQQADPLNLVLDFWGAVDYDAPLERLFVFENGYEKKPLITVKGKGRIVLADLNLLVGCAKYMVVVRNQLENTDEQRTYSIRLLTTQGSCIQCVDNSQCNGYICEHGLCVPRPSQIDSP